MAPKSTVYQFSLDISDIDRNMYHSEKLSVALHPSENTEYMMTRVLAWCLEYEEGIVFSRGLGDPDEPTLSIRGLDGGLQTWIEIGSPSVERLHRAAKAAARVAVYCHRAAEIVFRQLSSELIYRGSEISFYALDEAFIASACAVLERRNDLVVSRSEGSVYITMNGSSMQCELQERRLGGHQR